VARRALQDAAVCGGRGWIVGAPLGLASLGPTPVAGAVHPVIPLARRDCGNIRLLDAFVAGILPPTA